MITRFWLLCIALVLSFPAASQSIAGSWLNVTDEGLWAVGDGCVLRRLNVRRYTLDPAGIGGAAGATSLSNGGIVGTYTNTTWFRWVKRTSRSCAAPGEEALPAYATLRGWELSMTRSNGNDFDIAARRMACSNSFCDSPDLKFSDFKARLSYDSKSDSVTDRIPDDASAPPLSFERFGKNQRRATEIVDELLKRLLDAGTSGVDAFVDRYLLPPDPGDSAEARRMIFRTYAAVGLRPGTSFEVNDAYVATRQEGGRMVERIVAAVIVRSDPEGNRAIEFLELVSDAGRWKIGSLQPR